VIASTLQLRLFYGLLFTAEAAEDKAIDGLIASRVISCPRGNSVAEFLDTKSSPA